MLHHISWYHYILYSFSVIGIYYCYVLVAYYRGDLKDLLFNKKRQPQQSPDNIVIKEPAAEKFRAGDDSPEALEQLFGQAMILSEAIKSIFQEISFQEGTKEELFVLLQRKLKQYPALQATPFKVAIQNLIQTEAEKYQIDLMGDSKGINALWVGV
jgi:hypothetical protein